MLRLLVLLVGLGAGGTVLASDSLFDGASLDGWTVSGEAVWQVRDGFIEAGGSGDGFLVTRAQYRDFELRLEFWVDGDTNSGVFVGCPSPRDIHPRTCYEINIWDHHPQQEARSGAIVMRVMPPLVHVDTVDRWNRYRIQLRGGALSVYLNGELTARLDGVPDSPGHIALQHFGEGTVRFRNIVLLD